LSEPWLSAPALRQAALILASHRRLTGRDLALPPASSAVGAVAAQARALHGSPLVVLSHGIESDPILDYGNAAALALWEMTWETFTRMPSRLTAEPMERAERDRQLAAAAAAGVVEGYSGVRISASGRRFRITGATIWNLIDEQGWRRGQAVAFAEWQYL
jgi:hypothetical protein